MVRKKTYTGRPNSRRGIRYYRSDGRYNRGFDSSLYTHMFIEDLHLGVMPLSGRSTNPEFSVKIEPPSKEVEELVRLGLPSQHGEPRDVSEAVCNFIVDAAYVLAYYGRAYFEIVYFYNDEDKKRIEGFRLENIPNHYIKTALGSFWQYVPKEALQDEISSKRFIWLPKNNILYFSIPKQLGGNKKYRKVLSELQ